MTDIHLRGVRLIPTRGECPLVLGGSTLMSFVSVEPFGVWETPSISAMFIGADGKRSVSVGGDMSGPGGKKVYRVYYGAVPPGVYDLVISSCSSYSGQAITTIPLRVKIKRTDFVA